jgi:hypothetical protein
MSGGIYKSELPNPQKALTKLTKVPLTTPFVSFVSAFLHPQIAKSDVAAAESLHQLPFTRAFSTTVELARGGHPRYRRVATITGLNTLYMRQRAFVNGRAFLPCQMPEQLGLA